MFDDAADSDEEQRQKISANIADLIEPYYDPHVSLDEMHAIVSIGVLAWNLSLAKHEVGPSEIQEFCQKADITDTDAFTALLQEFIKRKEILLPDDTRLIVSWDIKKEHGQYQVMAATNFEP